MTIYGQGHTALEDGNPPYNELRIGVCYPPDAVVQSVMWAWKDDVPQVHSDPTALFVAGRELTLLA